MYTPLITFPTLKTKTLSGKELIFPDCVRGNRTIIAIAFEGFVQPIIDKWTKAILTKFPNNQINYYEIPMLQSGYALARNFIDGGMRQGTDPTLYDYVATYYGSLKDKKDQFNITDTKTVHLFLLNPIGEIINQISGEFSDEKFETFLKV
jgi:hypothetical protein